MASVPPSNHRDLVENYRLGKRCSFLYNINGTFTDPQLRDMPPTTPKGGNIFSTLGFSNVEAANLLLRSKLMTALTELINERGLTQHQAARLLGVSQPRISNLVGGKLDLFSVDTLIALLAKAGAEVTVAVRRKR
jgi:predicted XRE-type DNA-binding protein